MKTLWINFSSINHEYILGPAAYLAINAEASTENGNITKLRQLEINWYNIDDNNELEYRYDFVDEILLLGVANYNFFR